MTAVASRPAIAPGRPTPPKRSTAPSLREERRLIRDGHEIVAGMDEVGRGALAGPVTVGVVIVDAATRSAPTGRRDSKLLTPAARHALAPRQQRWALGWGVGHAEPDEIDALGIIAALRLAGQRALAQLSSRPSLVLLDGSHDWLSVPPPDLLDLIGDAGNAGDAAPCEPMWGSGAEPGDWPPVRTVVKADMRCAAVAAASVLAKTVRDAIMVERAERHPHYLWAENKGYSAPEHIAALRQHGPCIEHRMSWRLPGVGHCWNGGHDGGPDEC
jgi:ribonuclease HII